MSADDIIDAVATTACPECGQPKGSPCVYLAEPERKKCARRWITDRAGLPMKRAHPSRFAAARKIAGGNPMTDDMDLLARMPPAIVANDPRYQQATSHEMAIPWRDTTPDPPSQIPIWHLDGVDWYDAPPPRWLHRHWAQTVGHLYLGEITYRCACGAYGAPGQPWVTLNARRRRR